MRSAGNNYKAWNIKLSDFPKNGSMEEKIIFFTRFGILAANLHNTQPWLFDVNKERLSIFTNPQYQLSGGDPDGNNIYITVGCCIANIEVVASFFNFKTDITVSKKENNSFCILSFKPTTIRDKTLTHLAPYITKRYSNKRPYLHKEIEKHKKEILKKITIDGVRALYIDEKSTISKIARVHEQAVKGVASKKFTGELSQWVTGNNSQRADGMPGFVEGFSSPMALLGKFLLRYFPKIIVAIIAKKNGRVLNGSPLVGVIISDKMSQQKAINIGRLYQRIGLTSASLGIQCTPMHAVIEDKKNVRKLIDVLLLKKQKPRFVLRFGYSNNKPYHTPRRSLDTFYLPVTVEQKIIKSIPTPIVLQNTKIDNYILHYVVAGSGRPLLLIHGLNIGWGEWYPNIAELAKHFTVYAIDLPGSGNSTKIDYEKVNVERDFVKVVEKFILNKKLKKINIVGHSSGGLVALALAQRKKVEVNKVIAVSPMGFAQQVPFMHKLLSMKPFAKFISKTAMKPTKKNMLDFLTTVMVNKTINDDLVDHYVNSVNANKAHPFLLMNSFLRNFKLKEELYILHGKRIDNKTLIILGDKDPNIKPFNKEQIKKTIPNAIIKTYQHTGHVPSLEHANKFNAEVIQFIR